MTPRIAALAAAGMALLTLALGLYWKGRSDGSARERPRVEAALARAAAAELEAQGERDSAQRVEVVVRQRDAVTRTVQELTPAALASEDAHAPLPADRAARLRAHDDQLCSFEPELVGCAADRNASASGKALRDAPAP